MKATHAGPAVPQPASPAAAPSPPASLLTDCQLRALRSRADRTASSEVDPRRIYTLWTWWTPDHRAWAATVLGRPVDDLNRLPWRDWLLLELAHEREPSPPPPPQPHASPRNELRRQQPADSPVRHDADPAAAHAAAANREWLHIRHSLPVPVVLAHVRTSHPRPNSPEAGADHILALEEIQIGRFHRARGRPLCSTPARAKRLSDFADLPDPQRHRPTCRTCLRTAYRLTARTESDLLGPSPSTPTPATASQPPALAGDAAQLDDLYARLQRHYRGDQVLAATQIQALWAATHPLEQRLDALAALHHRLVPTAP